MEFQPFAFMAWAKAHGRGPGHRLTRSGMFPPPAALLGLREPLLELAEVDPYGPAEVAARLAARYGVPPDHVFLTGGAASLGLFLAVAALVRPGDLVLVEEPGYESLLRVPQFFHARTARLPRPLGAAPDPEALAAGLARGARLVLLTNLHNPFGSRLEGEELARIAETCARAGATLIVDEVFAEFLGPGERPPAAHAAHPAAVTVASFTKAFGLGSLRAGWVLAEPALARRLEQANDLVQVVNPTLPFRVLERVLEREEVLRAWLAGELGRVRGAQARLAAQPLLSFPAPAGGISVFAAAAGAADLDPLVRWLAEERQVHVVPGSFFGDPGRMRVSLALPERELEAGMAALLAGVEAWAAGARAD